MDRAISLEARGVDLPVEPPFHLGPIRVDPAAHEIVWRGGSQRLQPQALKVLVALHDKMGSVVTRDEIVIRCWDGRFVGDDVINRCISMLRRAGPATGTIEIQTVPRGGYRLVETALASVGVPAGRPLRLWIAGSAVALTGLVAAVLLTHSDRKPASPSPAPPTIELVPFVADSRDANTRALASASHDAIANTLAQGAYSLTVANERQAIQPPSDFVISGHLTGDAGNITASVQMTETAHQIVVFAHQFKATPENVGTLPQRIGAQVASQISWTAPLITLERRHPSNPAIARQLFEQASSGLKGAGNLSDYENSRRLAVAAPGSPLAQIDIAYDTAFALDQLPMRDRENAVEFARRSSERAINLAPESGEPYAPWCMLHSETRYSECESRLRTAVRIDPDAPFASWFLARLVLSAVGRNAEAAELARVSLAHDPYMPNKIGLAVELMEVAGRPDEAEQLYRKSRGLWPDNSSIVWDRFVGLVEDGDLKAAKRFNEESQVEADADPVLAAVSRKDVAQVRAACARADGFTSIICMLSLARSGDLDSAFAIADRLYPARHRPNPVDEDRLWIEQPKPTPVVFLTSPAAAPLRRDPRFLKLAQNLGLLDYWGRGRMPDFCTRAHEPECSKI